MSKQLYNKQNYTNSAFDYIPSTTIREYDIKSAGFNILISKGLLSEEQIEELSKLTKFERNVRIGLMQKNKEFAKLLNSGFKEYMRKFFEANDIDDTNVIAIKRDAIFLVNTRVKFTKFDNVVFVPKNKYSSYYRINDIELYYSKRENKLDVKGIKDDELHLHKHFMSFLKKLIKLNEISNVSARRYMYSFADRYRQSKLDIRYYREFKKHGEYRLKDSMCSSYFTIDKIDDVNSINISYNYMKIILPLIKMIF